MEPIKIEITLNAPELVSAINNLAGAISGMNKAAPAAEPEKPSRKSKAEKQQPSPEPEKPAEEILPAEEPTTTSNQPNEEPVSEISIEDLRAKLRSLSDAGKPAEMKQIIASFGVLKLSEIPADQYAAAMALAEKALKGEAIG